MDDIVLRSRYPRHSVSGKKRKRYAGEKSGLHAVFTRQMFFSLLILIAALAVKYADMPVSKAFEEKIHMALTADMELTKIWEPLSTEFEKMWNRKLPGTNAEQAGNNDGLQEKDTDISGAVAMPVSSNTGLPADDSSGGKSTAGILMMTVPVKGTLSSSFGERNDPVTGVKKIHEGIDIEAAKGECIKAALGGTVAEVRTSKSYGKYVKVKHKDNISTVYAHCSLISVKEGQEVKQGEAIAKVGSTGASLGDHLHFEIWKNGTAVNPLDYVNISK